MGIQNYLVVDLEATCCNDKSFLKPEMETIEIGAVMVDASDFIPIGEFNSFIRPVIHPQLTTFCRNLTSISQEDVDKADCFPLVFEFFCQWWMGFDGVLFCSWGPFDRNQFIRDCKYHEILYPFPDHLDLSRLFRRKTGRKAGHTRAMKSLGLKPEGRHHRGISDARNISKMLPMVIGDE